MHESFLISAEIRTVDSQSDLRILLKFLWLRLVLPDIVFIILQEHYVFGLYKVLSNNFGTE